MGRSILAVLLGYIAALVLLAFAYLGLAKWFPGDVPRYGSPLVIQAVAAVTVLCICFGAVGGWITARVAGRLPSRHVLALTIMTVVLGLLKPLLAPGAEPLASHLAFLAGLVAGMLIAASIAAKPSKLGESAT